MQSKTTIAIIGIIVIILGLWWYMSRGTTVSAPINTPASAVTQTPSTQSQTGASAQSSILPTDSSDTAINNDMKAVDASLNSLNSDTTNADKGGPTQ